MSPRARFYLRESQIAIVCWTALTYLYWLVAFFGPLQLAPFSSGLTTYIEGPGVQLEILVDGFLLGLFYSLIHYSTEHRVFRKRSFGQVILLKTLFQLASLMMAGILVYLLFSGLGMIPDMDRKEVEAFYSPRFLGSLLVWLAFCHLLVSFILEMRRKLGPGVLLPLMTGRYFQPREEERVFLFLDLKDSTTHTERLGHARYSQLIRACFDDLSELVLKFNAQIYQYVGDEVVLSWPAQTGAEDHCLELFQKFSEKLAQNSGHYRDRFETAPAFRGGADRGIVTVTEVGEVKRELAFHGDVLNTSARLLSECKTHGVELLVSENFRHGVSNQERLSYCGELELRGKLTSVKAYSPT